MAVVILTGFMGTGKTSIGKTLARRFSCAFLDTDELVERSEKRTVAEIFAAEGEAYFRAAERRAIGEAVAAPNAVIATGGGAIVDPDNFARLHEAGPIVCLTARADVIVRRARAAGETRPLLRGSNPRRQVEKLMAERAAAYAQADLAIDTSDLSVDDVVDRITAFLRPSRGTAS